MSYRALQVVTDQTKLQTCGKCGARIRVRLVVSYGRAVVVQQLVRARLWIPLNHDCGPRLRGLAIDSSVVDELAGKGAE